MFLNCSIVAPANTPPQVEHAVSDVPICQRNCMNNANTSAFIVANIYLTCQQPPSRRYRRQANEEDIPCSFELIFEMCETSLVRSNSF